MEQNKLRKLSQLYVDETLHADIKGLAKLRQQDIKVIVTNLFRSEFKTDRFFAYCKDMHKQNVEERRRLQLDPVDFDAYCASNLEWLKDEYHKSL